MLSEWDIQAVSLDLDDTLHEFRAAAGKAAGDVLDHLSESLGADRELMQRSYEKNFTMPHGYFVDGRTSHDYRGERFRRVLAEIGAVDETLLRAAMALYDASYLDGLEPLPDALEFVEGCAARFGKVIICSEAPHDAQERVLNRLGLDEHVAGLVTSNREGVCKATGLFYQVAARADMAGDRILHVGDRLSRDIIPARQAGLRAIWVPLHDEENRNGETAYSMCDLRGMLAQG